MPFFIFKMKTPSIQESDTLYLWTTELMFSILKLINQTKGGNKMKKEIEYLLFESGISNYRISKETGISQPALNKYTNDANGSSKIGNMSLDNAIKIYNYYLEEMEIMENDIKRHINNTIDSVINSSKGDIERGYSYSMDLMNGMITALGCVIDHALGYEEEKVRLAEFKKSWSAVENRVI